MSISEQKEAYRAQFSKELANLIGCPPDAIPPTVNKKLACKFLGITNVRTLNVWKCNGRHGIVMLRVGKKTEPTTNWLLDFKLSCLSIAQEAIA